MNSIVTFYSFKGGVGRSMALANIAVLLARRGLRTLAIDWDLEAPGLERYFDYFELKPASGGLLHFLKDASNNLESGQPPGDYRDHLWSVNVGQGVPLALLPSGRTQHLEYASQLQAFDWRVFFDRGGGDLLEELRAKWRESFDIVLIDSRTGMSDAGGVCTIQLPDVLVAMFTANHQSMSGVRDVIQSAQEGRQRLAYDRMPLTVLPLVSRFAATTEFRESQVWLDRVVEMLGDCFTDWLPQWVSPRAVFERLKIPQIDWFSFGERLAVVEQGVSDPAGLGFVFDRIADLLASDFTELEPSLGSVARKPDGWSASRQQRAAKKDAVAENDYTYDVYVSYPAGGGIVAEWTNQFVQTLQKWLESERGRPVRLFVPSGRISPSESLPAVLDQALNGSRVLLAIVSPSYFASDWCLREWATFTARARATNTRTGLVLPVVLRGMSHLPKPVKEILVLDASNLFNFERPEISSSSPEEFRLVQAAANALVQMIEAAPPFRSEWHAHPAPEDIEVLRPPPADRRDLIVSTNLTEHEWQHLRNLAAPSPFNANLHDNFLEELRKLLALRLIQRRPAHGFRTLQRADPSPDVKAHFELTNLGRNLLNDS